MKRRRVVSLLFLSVVIVLAGLAFLGLTERGFRQLVRRLRSAMPHLTLTTDVITGFCGETEEDLSATIRLLEDVPKLTSLTGAPAAACAPPAPPG